MDQSSGAVLHHPGGLAVGLVVPEPGSEGGDLTGTFTGGNFGNFSPKLIGTLSLPFADLLFDGLDGDPLGRREVFADLILCVFAGDDAFDINDSGKNRLILEDVPVCSETAFTEDQFQLFRDADGLEETVLTNAVGQALKVAHVLAVAVADFDVGDFEFLEHHDTCY